MRSLSFFRSLRRRTSRALLAGLAPGAALAGNTAITAAPRDAGWVRQHERYVARAKQSDVDVLFLGDSITQHWGTPPPEGGLAIWEKEFAPLQAANFGISGDCTQHVLWRIDHGTLDGLTPKVVVLLIGTNNTGFEKGTRTPRNSVPETIAGINAVVQALITRLPDAKILLLGVFPRGATPADFQRQQVGEINAALRPLHDGNRIFFHDFTDRFLSADGSISPEIMPDFLHLNAAGYRLWADALREPLATLLASSRR